jgi:hypothetical protein
MRAQNPAMRVTRLPRVTCSGETISVGTAASARSVKMFIIALYVRAARYLLLATALDKG